MGKEEIARNEQFLLYPQCFLPVWRTFCHCHYYQNCRLQSLSVLKCLKFAVWDRVKEWTPVASIICDSFPKQQILDSSKLKDFADDDFKFDENGRKILKQVENT